MTTCAGFYILLVNTIIGHVVFIASRAQATTLFQGGIHPHYTETKIYGNGQWKSIIWSGIKAVVRIGIMI